MPTTRFLWDSVLLVGISGSLRGPQCAFCIVGASRAVPAPSALDNICTVLMQAGQGLPRKVAAWHGSDNHTGTSKWRLPTALPITEVSQWGE